MNVSSLNVYAVIEGYRADECEHVVSVWSSRLLATQEGERRETPQTYTRVEAYVINQEGEE